jgi:hypothetical protein
MVRARAAADQCRALRRAAGDVAGDPLPVRSGDLRAHLSAFRQWVADADAPRQRREAVQEFVVDGLLHENARRRLTRLPDKVGSR